MTKDALNPDLIEIELLTKRYADALNDLTGLATDAMEEINAAKRKRLTRLRNLAGKVSAARAELIAAIEAHPSLFKRPKTRDFYGIRVGWMKRKGSLKYKDADVLVKRIKTELPDQVETLIQRKETPVKAALQQLSAAVLKKLGVRVEDDSDEPFIKTRETEVLKQINAWLESAEQEEGQ